MKSEQIRTSRRSVIQGAAWSLPVITAAAATPLYAVSPGDDPAWGYVRFNTFAPWDENHDGKGGPIHVKFQIYYKWYKEGAPDLDVPWLLQISRDGEVVFQDEGVVPVAHNTESGEIIPVYPGAQENIPAGQYTVLLTIPGTDVQETAVVTVGGN